MLSGCVDQRNDCGGNCCVLHGHAVNISATKCPYTEASCLVPIQSPFDCGSCIVLSSNIPLIRNQKAFKMPESIKTAILGTGIALKHLHWPLMGALPDMFNVTTIMERKMAGVAKSVCGDKLNVVATLDEVLSSDIELVDVATSDKTHYEYCKRSLEASKHGEWSSRLQNGSDALRMEMFCEKPLTYTAAEAANLEKIAVKTGRVLDFFQCRRWDGDFLTVKKLIESNKVRRYLSLQTRGPHCTAIPICLCQSSGTTVAMVSASCALVCILIDCIA